MPTDSVLKRYAYTTLTSILLAGLGTAAGAQNLPSYMEPISGRTASTPAETANRNMLALNTAMFDLYGDAGRIYKKNILAKHPVILALFSGAGGRMILYRPGQAALDAPGVPLVYQIMKSVGHSSMALVQVVGPYLDNADDQSWRAPMLAFRSRMKSALDDANAAEMPADWRGTVRTILTNNIAFMDECLAGKVITLAALQAFSKKQAPYLKEVVAWAAETQVTHWMSVLDGWKKMLGADWDKAYGASNTIFVARQNNVLFSVLAQYFGPEAINDRLLLIETISFTTTPDDMLEALTRVVADRAVGALFFGNDRLMDYELMGSDARRVIIAESKKRGREAFLPPLVPFGSKQWPTLITPGPGPATIADLK